MKTDKKGSGKSMRLPGWIIMLAGFALWILLLRTGEDPARAWRALLINFVYFTPLSAGLVTWSAIVISANGHWAGTAERLAWTGLGFLAPSLIILIILWIGSPAWTPWYGKILRQGLWLNNDVVFLRQFVGLLIFWSTAFWFLQTRSRGRKSAVAPAAIVVVVFSLVFTLFGFDLVMALTPEWRSALFGAYFFISSLYTAVVFWTLLAVMHPDSPVPVRQDLGKLILAFSILTTSFLFMQLLTIWYENIPEETTYLVDRMHHPGWMIITTALLIIVYFGPLLLLMSEWAKKNRMYLGGVSILLLIGLWVERWWLIAPSFSHEVQFGVVELAAFAVIGGGLALSIQAALNYLPDLPKEEVGAE